MSRPFPLCEWQHTLATHLTGLSGPQAGQEAGWSWATVVLGTCGRETVSAFLADFLNESEDAVRQRLREWYCEPQAKKGDHRQALPVATCFAALLRWVLAWWPAGEHQLAVALDATSLGDLFTVLAVCVLYRACAMPIAWTVVALADRGLHGPWLYRSLKKMHWHPFLRLNTQGHYRPRGARVWRTLANAAPAPAPPGREPCTASRVAPSRRPCSRAGSQALPTPGSY